jgi:nucleotide-binding universal stress UspA family protein
MKILVLIDGLHTREMLAALEDLVDLRRADLILVYVRGPGPRASLELLRRRPGRHSIPPHRDRQLHEAEVTVGDDALVEAEELARATAAGVETVLANGDAGRAVCDLARARGVDLIAVRSGRQLGPAARFIADHAPGPVLLLRSRVDP